MDELSVLVEQAKGGDLDAFSVIVGRFQDMALGYAYSVVGDFHMAEDVAQEAFVNAYQSLDDLRELDAFLVFRELSGSGVPETPGLFATP